MYVLTSLPRPSNSKELFNLRHAQARNVIERIFGVVKRRFAIMIVAPEYGLDVQAKLVAAICVLHNFIRVHDPDDTSDEDWEELERHAPQREARDFGGHTIGQAEQNRASRKRDEIAAAMWRQYQEYTGML